MRYVVVFLCLFLAGCVTTKPSPILTSSEESWYIPKGETFQAQKTPADPLTAYKAEDDLMVLYMGKYLELEKQADKCSK